MLARILHEITSISENDTINLENYMESINFINNVYRLINKLKMIIPISKVTFDSSFKGRMTCEKFNLSSNIYENEMKYFSVHSIFFLEDQENKKEQIEKSIGPLCESIKFDGEQIKFLLK